LDISIGTHEPARYSRLVNLAGNSVISGAPPRWQRHPIDGADPRTAPNQTALTHRKTRREVLPPIGGTAALKAYPRLTLRLILANRRKKTINIPPCTECKSANRPNRQEYPYDLSLLRGAAMAARRYRALNGERCPQITIYPRVPMAWHRKYYTGSLGPSGRGAFGAFLQTWALWQRKLHSALLVLPARGFRSGYKAFNRHVMMDCFKYSQTPLDCEPQRYPFEPPGHSLN
jgi:hypothetical protein